MKLSQIVFPRFKKFSHVKATLNFYLDFVKSPQGKAGYYYRALFTCENKTSNKSFFIIELIPVELLPLIPSGYTYLFDFGKITKKTEPDFLKSAQINLSIPPNQEVKQLSEFIDSKKFRKFGFLNKENQYVSFEKEISSQFVVKVEHNNSVFLIPSTLIASQFYFFSSRIIPYVLRNALKDTHKGITVDGNSYKIVMSSYFSSSDAPKIVFFLTNKYAKKSLATLSQKNFKWFLSEKLKFPIYARFPFTGDYPCEVFFEVIENYRYVHFLNFTDGRLPYQKLNVEVIRIKTQKADEKEVNFPKTIPLQVFEESEEKEYELVKVQPSKYVKSLGLRTTFEKNEIPVKKSLLLSESITARAKAVFLKAKQEVKNVSFEDKAKPYNKVEKETAKVEAVSERLTEKSDYEKNLGRFKEMLQVLQEKFKFEIRFMRELFVPIRRKDKNSISQVEYYDWQKVYEGKKPTLRRKFLLVIGKFPEVENLVAFLEVDQTNMSYSLSTIVFISKMESFNFDFFKKSAILFLEKKLEGFKEEHLKNFMRNKGIEVYFKKHPSSWSMRAITSWCRRVKEVVENLLS